MKSIESLESAIRALAPADRARVLELLQRSADEIHEPAAAYEVSPSSSPLSVEEYLRFEEASDIRHEYVGGIAYAMTGASRPHNLVAGNLFAALHAHVRGGPCEAYMSDFKVRLEIDRNDIFYYPDVMVSCRRDGMEDKYLRYPTVVAEVLSPSTAAIDRREKLVNYAQISSLEEYVIASQHLPEIAIHRRSDLWAPQLVSGCDAVLELHSLRISIPLTEIYDRVLASHDADDAPMPGAGPP